MEQFDSTMRDVAAAPVRPTRLLSFSNDAEMESLHSDQQATIGNCRRYGCTRLTALDVTGLARLATVGGSWLSGCTSLTALDCTGLTQLATVGDCWLSGCPSLTVLDCTGLTQLATVGGSWLSGCTSLTAVKLAAGETSVAPWVCGSHV